MKGDNKVLALAGFETIGYYANQKSSHCSLKCNKMSVDPGITFPKCSCDRVVEFWLVRISKHCLQRESICWGMLHITAITIPENNVLIAIHTLKIMENFRCLVKLASY